MFTYVQSGACVRVINSLVFTFFVLSYISGTIYENVSTIKVAGVSRGEMINKKLLKYNTKFSTHNSFVSWRNSSMNKF